MAENTWRNGWEYLEKGRDLWWLKSARYHELPQMSRPLRDTPRTVRKAPQTPWQIRPTWYILTRSLKVNFMITQSITEESQFLLQEIFQGDTVAESICLRDLIQWAGENPLTINTEDLAQLVIYSEDKLRELFDIYCDVFEWYQGFWVLSQNCINIGGILGQNYETSKLQVSGQNW